jgi:hypothetical protein
LLPEERAVLRGRGAHRRGRDPIYVYIFIDIYAHIYIHIFMYIYVYFYVYMYIYVHKCICTYIYINTYIGSWSSFKAITSLFLRSLVLIAFNTMSETAFAELMARFISSVRRDRDDAQRTYIRGGGIGVRVRGLTGKR